MKGLDFSDQTVDVLNYAQLSLKFARMIQIIQEENRFDLKNFDFGPDTPVEKTNFLINHLVEGRLKYVSPVEEHKDLITKLETLRTFTGLYMDVFNKKVKPPASEATDRLIKIVESITLTLFANITYLAGEGIIL